MRPSATPFCLTSIKGSVIIIARSPEQASAYYKLRFGKATRHTMVLANEEKMKYFSTMKPHAIFTACIPGGKE